MLELHSLRVLASTGASMPLVPATGLDFSWKLRSDRTNVRQVSRRIVLLEDTPGGLRPVCDTGDVPDSNAVHVPCPVPALRPRTMYELRVTVSCVGSAARSTPPCPSGASPLSEGGRNRENSGAFHLSEGSMAGEMPPLEREMAPQPPPLMMPPSERGVAAEPPGGVLRAAPKAEIGNALDTASATLRFATAPDSWTAEWIREPAPRPCWAPCFRRKFRCDRAAVRRATLYAAGLGCAEFRLNGRPLSDALLDPPSSNYEREIYFRAYDLTGALLDANALVATVGDGWYAQRLAWDASDPCYGPPCLIAEIDLEYADGSVETLASNSRDGLWRCAPSPVVHNNLYSGEIHDARLERPGDDLFDDPDDGWLPTAPDTAPKGALLPAPMPSVRIRAELAPRAIRPVAGIDDGAWIYDFGENIAGVCELRLPPAPAGSRVVLRFAETLRPDGSLDYRSCGGFATHTLQEDVYIMRGDPAGETWRPRFTYHGFRYAELSGVNGHGFPERGLYRPEWLRALALSTDLAPAGSFRCGHADTDALQRIFLNTFLSNYHGHPEDCPVREKCGWLGDAQILCSAAIDNFDMEAAYAKYLDDIASSHARRGLWTNIAPGRRDCTGQQAYPLWGCAQVLIPYWMYRHYGCASVVRRHWDAMESWVALQANLAERNGGTISIGLGDWIPPGGNKNPRRIPVEHSSTLMLLECALRMEELAAEFAPDRVSHYRALAEHVRETFHSRFWDSATHSYGTWASDAAALLLGVPPDAERDALLRASADRIRADDFAMPTGIYGNKVLVEALAANGLQDLIPEILFNRRHGSFATMLDRGATTLWEGFDQAGIGDPPDVRVPSYSHPMHGGFLSFLFERVAGIRPLRPGYETFEIAPIPFAAYPTFTAERETPRGMVRVALSDGLYRIEVPPNTTCTLRLPGRSGETLGSGIYERA